MGAPIRILPPVKGTCRSCATAHEKGTPHDVHSLYYMIRFRQEFGMYPSESDCDNWIDRRNRLPQEKDADSQGNVFAWHQYQGAMLVHWSRFERNSFHLFWMNPLEDTSEWISVNDRAPSATDSDHTNCVVAMCSGNQMSVTGWRQVREDTHWEYWKRLPSPPVLLTDLKKAR